MDCLAAGDKTIQFRLPVTEKKWKETYAPKSQKYIAFSLTGEKAH